MDTKVIPSHVSPGGKILYVSERDQLVDAWFRMNWQINIGSEIVRGPLMFFEPEIYVTKEGIEPEFEIEVVDENGLPMYVRAIYSRFEP